MQHKTAYIISTIFLIYLGAMGIYGAHTALKKEEWKLRSGVFWEKKRLFEDTFFASFSDNEKYLSPLAQAKLILARKAISPKVIPGKDGWLFLGEEENGRNTLMQSTGLKYLDSKTLFKWKLLLSQRKDWCEKNGINYFLILPPNKANIYPEYLPDRIHPLPGPDFIEKLSDEFRSNGIRTIYLSDAVFKGKREMQVYYKNDTHWSDFGAYLGAEVILDSISQTAGVKVMELKYQFEPLPGTMRDLARMSMKAVETELVPTLKQPGPVPYIEDRQKAKLFPEYLACELTLNESGELPKTQFFHDSFGEMLKPFLSSHFKEIQYFRVWQGFEPYWIQLEKPEIVLNQIVERAFLGDLPLNNAWLVQDYWSSHWNLVEEIHVSGGSKLSIKLPTQSMKGLKTKDAIFVLRLTLQAKSESWINYVVSSKLQKFDLQPGENQIFLEVDPANPGHLEWDSGHPPVLKELKAGRLDISSTALIK